MNFLNPTNVWQAQNLPDGLSFNHGVISGTPTNAGNFSVPVTVSNPLGSDTKNISILVKYRPGTQKFSILQDGVEVTKLTIPELQAMVQDGTAQSQFNCTNTQIILPILTPALKYILIYFDNDQYKSLGRVTSEVRPPSIENVAVNFCSFRDVTLQDGSTRPGLFLQFDKALWNYFAPFDTGDSIDSKPFNRWKYSNLRQWFNSEGINWFHPAYDGDALVTWQELCDAYVLPDYQYKLNDPNLREDALIDLLGSYSQSTYADDNIPGFLDLLPDDIHSILQPIKIITQAFFDENNTNLSIDDPEDVDGYDADITYDKVFIPSLKEMLLGFTDPYYETVETMQAIAQEGVEGEPWEFFINKFSSVAYSTKTSNSYDWIKEHNGEWPYYITDDDGPFFSDAFSKVYPFLDEWGQCLKPPISGYESEYGRYSVSWASDWVSDLPIDDTSQAIVTRTAVDNSTYGIWSVRRYRGSYDDGLIVTSTRDYSNPVPAFVIC